MEPIVQPPSMPLNLPYTNTPQRPPGQQRTRRPVACDSCRLRKHKCVFDGNGGPPCENCVKYGRECTFGGPLDANRTGPGGPGDGRKQPRCDMCKEKKMACVYDSTPPCITCKTKGVDCTFNIAGVASGGWPIPPAPGDVETVEEATTDSQDIIGDHRA
ncbi:hypothetical protein K431DRAFT_289046 [Polychaeton citri CBS 116435]|uniref:Zn(2)-C6 fungal-type domain-containing protein n=1 Tax=Polychaeton citri CBS 116435 TaxID=1314669 RepID=A0A9P4PXR8_9PEZI|nr:hypothetical protein K431DRAFT_289046 [Polychaeton citri CBS 116435]